MENNSLSENTSTEKPKEIRLADIQITDENVALNVLVSFLAYAQKKGIFTFDESAKIWECIQMFQKSH
jgi:hypothetical protein